MSPFAGETAVAVDELAVDHQPAAYTRSEDDSEDHAMTPSGTDFRFGDHEAIRVVRYDDGKVQRLFQLVLQDPAMDALNIGDSGFAGVGIDDARNRQRHAGGCAAAIVDDGFQAGGEVFETGLGRRDARHGPNIVGSVGNSALDGRSAYIETNDHDSGSGTGGIVDFFCTDPCRMHLKVGRQHDEIRIEAGQELTLAGSADCLGGIGGRHSQGFFQRCVQLFMHEAYAGEHIDIRSRQRAVGQRQPAAVAIDAPAVQFETVIIRADGGHGVGDEENAPGIILGAKRNADRCRIDMEAVSDQPAIQLAVRKCRPHQSRLAMAERAHSVEEMCHHGCACLGIGRRDAKAHIGMAEADDDAGFVQRCDLRFGYVFRGDGCQHEGKLRLAAHQNRKIGRFHLSDQRRIMGALACDGKMRPFEVQAEKAGHPCLVGGDAGFGGFGCDIRPVGDECDHQRCGTELRMGRADAGDAFHIRLVIEHHAAAAIDLKVDEAWRNEQSFRVDDFGVCWHGYAVNNVGNVAITGHERFAIVPRGAIENAGADKCLAAAHWVSVTFFNATGASGLKPRARDNCSMKP
ncbi:hypothetical protein AGR7B_Cc270066 [Agrobacterium deltaense RV3]|nr:hypothetical protein AGR7B_Cc270066 [Agrobacterium deltaense RV3]